MSLEIREMTAEDLADMKSVVDIHKQLSLQEYEHLKDDPRMREAVTNLYLFKFNGDTGSFNEHLFALIQVSDFGNRAKLKFVFRYHVVAWEAWYYAHNEDEFFRGWGFKT